MSVAQANMAVWRLLDNEEAQDAEDYQVTCDERGGLITEDDYGERDGLCEACHAAVHFTCDECGEEFHLDEQSEEFPRHCVGCGCDKHTKIADGLLSELEDLAGSWSGEEYEISRLRKLLAYAKRLK
jgi:hypothetical protein